MFKLRDYQKSCVDCILEDLKTYQKVGAILPTGAGKTEIFIEVIRNILFDHTSEVLILSHLSILTHQTRERIKKRINFPDVGVLQANIQPHFNDRVVISTMQSSRVEDKISQWQSSKNQARDLKLIIIDEAHYIQTKSYTKILEMFPKVKVLGVTATPYRDKRLMTNFFDKISYSMSMQDLIEKGFLVKPELHEILTVSDFFAEKIARIHKIFLKNPVPSVIFLNTKEDVGTVRNHFRRYGIKAEPIIADTKKEKRNEVIKDFKKGKVKILLTVNVLSEGFDAPNLEAIFLPFQTNSPTRWIQRIGRGLRIHEGKKSCKVYCIGNTPKIEKGYYKELNKNAMIAGKKYDNPQTLKEDLKNLEYKNEIDTTEYKWTKDIVNIADRFEKLGSKTISDLILERKFPVGILRNNKFIENFKQSKKISKVMRGMATQPQKNLLKKFDFNYEVIKKLTKAEASNIIDNLVRTFMPNKKKYDENYCKQKHILTKGKFAGTHISQVPYAYKNWVLENIPDSSLAKQIKEYSLTNKNKNKKKRRKFHGN